MPPEASIDSVRSILVDVSRQPSEKLGQKVIEEINAFITTAGNDTARKNTNLAAVNKLIGDVKIDMDGDGQAADESIAVEGGKIVVKHIDESGKLVAYEDAAQAFSGRYALTGRGRGLIVLNPASALTDRPPRDSKLSITAEDPKTKEVTGVQPIAGSYGSDQPRWYKDVQTGKWIEEHGNREKLEIAHVKFASNGDVHVKHTNDCTDVRSQDGTTKKYDKKGELKELYPGTSYANDGTRYVIKNEQWYQIRGNTEEAVKNVSVRENGDILVIYKDQKSELRNRQGEIFKYDKDGKIEEVHSRALGPGMAWKRGQGELPPAVEKRANESAPSAKDKSAGQPGSNSPREKQPERQDDAKPGQTKAEVLGRHKINIETTEKHERIAVVKKGDNLWWIAEELLKKDKKEENYKPSAKEILAMIKKIKELNAEIGSKDIIQPGWRLKLPNQESNAKMKAGEGEPTQSESNAAKAEQVKKNLIMLHKQFDFDKNGNLSSYELTQQFEKLQVSQKSPLDPSTAKASVLREHLNNVLRSFNEFANLKSKDNEMSQEEWLAYFERASTHKIGR